MGATLSNIHLFADVPAEALARIEQECTWTRFAEGEQVFDKESDTLDVYFVVEGSVRILNMITEDQEVALADIVAGNCFGELAAIDGMKRSARVIATTDSVLASLNGAAFLEVLRAHHSVTIQVLARLTRMVRSLDSRVVKMSSQTEHQRIWTELLRLAVSDPIAAGIWHIPDMPNHREIAAWAGTSKESVAAAIGELAREGIVKRKSMGLVISDMPRLQNMAQSA